MTTAKWLLASTLMAIAINVAGVQTAHAEPLTPLSPAELQFLDQVRRVFSVSRDNAAFRSDGELLDDGRFVCRQRASKLVGHEATLVSPVVIQLAFIYLCPN